MNPPPTPLLTVGIPTWNRCRLLSETIESVRRQAEQAGLADEVEIVVCDNASTDGTGQVVAALAAGSRVAIRYHRNETNIGPRPNLLKTIELARGMYWMFYGDDDLMVEGALASILEAFRRQPDSAVFLFQPPDIRRPTGPARLSIEEAARRYFYLLGNAGMFALRTAEARRQLALHGAAAFQTCWPQTQLAFLVMAAAPGDRPLAVSPVAGCASPHHAANTVYTSWYVWEAGVYALYRTALSLRPALGPSFVAAACRSILSGDRVFHTALELFRRTTIHEPPADVATTRRSVGEAVRSARGWPRVVFLFFWMIIAAPRGLKYTLLLASIVLRSPTRVVGKLRGLREARQAHRSRTAGAGGPEPTGYYRPGDI
jgi:glycosyltransferase involved in cell wall biosynthesis